jgi:DNA replication ATP-dependent helicase Dna2
LIDHKLDEAFTKLVSSLKPIHSEFFKKWDSLITKEESEMMKFRRELWTMLSKEREKVNRCFGNVIIVPGSTATESGTASKINRFQYTFMKESISPGFSFAESQITVGEPIVVSDERGHFALANGYVTHIHRLQITVAVDRRLHNARIRKSGFCSQTNQAFGGIMELDPKSSAPKSSQEEEQSPILYRIDKDEFSNGMATVRNNMLQIMDDSVFKAADLRALIIEDREPVFKEPSSGWTLPAQAEDSAMNSDQKAAVAKVMQAKDYALVLGMPGTGKTTTIAQIIRSLVAKGKSVLLTSYTHTAVDNILLKIRNANIDILRLGVIAKIHPEVREFATLAAQTKDSLEEIWDSWTKPLVVATTCLGINHPLFQHRIFDYCIVDEASQITLPVCLGPIRMAKSFILVGDHYQLPPIVQNKEALAGGLDMSLFRLLSERHPEAVVSLEHQYRMSEDIMSIANKLIYSGRLKCGNSVVANRVLDLPRIQDALLHHHYSPQTTPQPRICPSPSSADCFLTRILTPENRVLFLNTDPLTTTAHEISQGNRTTNPFEATLVSHLTHLLLSAGLSSSDLGVVTFYRSQLALLRQSLRAIPNLELHTADKFQGRDKEVVIVSFVRSNQDGHLGDLLRDWRRINVAVTRARSKLVLVGSARTLASGSSEVLRGLVDMSCEQGWMVQMPVHAADMHLWPEMAGTPSGEGVSSSLVSSAKASSASRQHVPGGSVLSPRRGGVNRIMSPTKMTVAGVKKAGRTGSLGQRVLKARPLMNDILNEVLVGGWTDENAVGWK